MTYRLHASEDSVLSLGKNVIPKDKDRREKEK